MIQKCGIADEVKGFTVFIKEGGIFLPLVKEGPAFLIELAGLLNVIATLAVYILRIGRVKYASRLIRATRYAKK